MCCLRTAAHATAAVRRRGMHASSQIPLSPALPLHPACPPDYIGCFKTGQIIKSRRYRWFEPQHVLLGGQGYFAHAWGSAYVLSGRAATDLAAQRPGALRHFANEGAPGASARLRRQRAQSVLRHARVRFRAPGITVSPRLPCPHADVTIGAWLLAFNATHWDDRRLCETNCTESSVAVYDIPVRVCVVQRWLTDRF